MPPLPIKVSREATGQFGFTRETAAIQLVVTAGGATVTMETVQGQTVIHRGGDPNSPLIQMSSVVQRFYGEGGVLDSEAAQSNAASRFFGDRNSIGTSGSFTVGTPPEMPQSKP